MTVHMQKRIHLLLALLFAATIAHAQLSRSNDEDRDPEMELRQRARILHSALNKADVRLSLSEDHPDAKLWKNDDYVNGYLGMLRRKASEIQSLLEKNPPLDARFPELKHAMKQVASSRPTLSSGTNAPPGVISRAACMDRIREIGQMISTNASMNAVLNKQP